MIRDRMENLVGGGTDRREAGIESLDGYSDHKVVNLVIDPART